MVKITENNELDLSVLEVSDIIDIKLLQDFQDNFAIGMNCASVTVDRNGQPVTNPSSYTRYCSGIIQSTSEGKSRCAQSHKTQGEQAAKNRRPFVGTCHAGLTDFAAPIIIENEIIGTVLGGQVLEESCNENTALRIAEELNYDATSTVEEMKKISIVTNRSIQAAAEVLFVVVNSLATNGYNNLKLQIASKKLSNNFMQTSATIEELSASAINITTEQEKLNTEIKEVGSATEEITTILDAIKSIASQTKMLGLNASIEAARAGEAGKGFSVVATQIQNLSENSKKTADEIMQLTKKIQQSVNDTITSSETTLSTSKEQAKAMEEISQSIQEAANLSEELTSIV